MNGANYLITFFKGAVMCSEYMAFAMEALKLEDTIKKIMNAMMLMDAKFIDLIFAV